MVFLNRFAGFQFPFFFILHFTVLHWAWMAGWHDGSTCFRFFTVCFCLPIVRFPPFGFHFFHAAVLSFEIIRKAFSVCRCYGFAFDFVQGFILKQLIGFKAEKEGLY